MLYKERYFLEYFHSSQVGPRMQNFLLTFNLNCWDRLQWRGGRYPLSFFKNAKKCPDPVGPAFCMSYMKR